MGFSIFKSFKLGSLLKVNLTSSGVSISAGPTGAKITYKLLGKDQGKTSINAQKSLFGIPIRYRKTLISGNNDQEFRWKNSYGVGNRQMNYEHKLIIGEVQELKDAQDLEGILERIALHTRTHFSNEELLLQHYQVPNYEAHKQAHDDLLARLKTPTKEDYQSLAAWWEEHLTTLDKSYAPYLKKS
jgi:hemerythrin